MEVQDAHDDEMLLLESSNSPTRRVWPVVCAATLLVGAVAGGRAILSSSHIEDVTNLHEYPWYAAWRSHPQRFDANGCTLDGDDCRSSKCCAKVGSRCFVKNHHWASCNETCYTHKKWVGSVDRRGHWISTHHPVWECVDLTVSLVATSPPTAAPTVVVQVPAPAPPPSTSPPVVYSIYEQSEDFKTSKYEGGELASRSSAESSSVAPVTWEEAA